MKQAKKGLKGFQPIAENLKKTERYNLKLTKGEMNAINNFCKTNGMTKADFISGALKDFYVKNNIVVDNDNYINPNQLRIEG